MTSYKPRRRARTHPLRVILLAVGAAVLFLVVFALTFVLLMRWA
jgi:Tfp pilus assembly protein PilN